MWLSLFFILVPLFWARASWVTFKVWRISRAGLAAANFFGAVCGLAASALIGLMGAARITVGVLPPDVGLIVLVVALILFSAPAFAFEVLYRSGFLEK